MSLIVLMFYVLHEMDGFLFYVYGFVVYCSLSPVGFALVFLIVC